MANPQNNPNDAFWLARYAHNKLTPILDALPGEATANLQLSMSFKDRYPGTSVWIHYNTGDGGTGVITWKLHATQADVDRMAEQLPNLWAAKFAVTA